MSEKQGVLLTLFINGEKLYDQKPVDLVVEGEQCVLSFTDPNTQLVGHTVNHPKLSDPTAKPETWSWSAGPQVTKLARKSSVVEMIFDSNAETKSMIYSPYGDIERSLVVSQFRYQAGGGEYRFDVEYYFVDAKEQKNSFVLMVTKA